MYLWVGLKEKEGFFKRKRKKKKKKKKKSVSPPFSFRFLIKNTMVGASQALKWNLFLKQKCACVRVMGVGGLLWEV